jgi:hypothetical protein
LLPFDVQLHIFITANTLARPFANFFLRSTNRVIKIYTKKLSEKTSGFCDVIGITAKVREIIVQWIGETE